MSTFVRELSGHSGCYIYLYKGDDGYFVRKLSGSQEYNKRLERQIVKQAAFKHPILRAPKVYSTGYIDGYYYADMEYIDGKTVSALISEGEYHEAGKALYNIMTMFDAPKTTLYNAQDVIDKVASMHGALSKFSQDEYCRQILARLDEHQWETHPATCHGDLTLENMLVKDGEVYLIDFLDSFHDCLEADIAKLLQDLLCMWSFRYHPLDEKGVQFVHERAKAIIAVYASITTSSTLQLDAMLQLTLLRIYPYIKDDVTKEFLDTTLRTLFF